MKPKRKSQPEASAPGNPLIRPASAEEDIVWDFSRMAGDQALEAINKGKRPKLCVLTLTKDGETRLMRHQPSLRSADVFLQSLNCHWSKSGAKLMAFGFPVWGAGHLLAGVAEAFVVFSLSNNSATAFAHRIRRNCSGKADLVKEFIVVENPLRLLSHAFGFIDHAPDTKERRELWTGILKNNRR